MNKIIDYPPSLILLSALIGGVVGAPLLYVALDPWYNLEIVFPIVCLFGAVSGLFFGVLSGAIVYAKKPRIWASIMGAALGGALIPMMCWAMSWVGSGVSSLRESRVANRLEQMYPEPKPIPALKANYQELASGEYIESCAMNSDGSRLALGSDNQITLWDLKNHKQVWNFHFDSDNRILALSPDSLTLANGYPEGVNLWDVKTGGELAQFGSNAVGSLVFSPDGRLLAWRESMEAIVVWDPLVGEELTRIKVPNIYSLAFSPNSKLIAAGYSDGQITLLDTATRKSAGELQEAESVFGLAFSPDGSRLAAITAGRSDANGIGLWDVDTRVRLAGTWVPSGNNVSFSPDGQKLISTGWSSSIYFWDANSLEPLGSVKGPNADESEAYVLPDGRVLACYWNQNVDLPDRIGIWTIEPP